MRGDFSKNHSMQKGPFLIEERAFSRLSGLTGNYALNEEPQPQVLFTWGLSNLKPAASRVST